MNVIHRSMDWAGQHPKRMLFILAVLSILAAIPASRVHVDTSIDSLMMRDDPEREFYENTRELFGSEAMAVVYIEDQSLFTPEKLGLMQELLFALESIDEVEFAESLFSVTDLVHEENGLSARPLIDWIPESQQEADIIRERAIRHPVIKQMLISPNAETTAIHLRLDMPDGHDDATRNVSAEIESIIEQFSPNFQRIDQIGRPYIIAMETNYIMRDQRIVLPLAVVVMVTMLLLTLSSVKGAVIPLLTAGISVLWTLGFMGLIGLPITVLTFMVPSLILVIGSTEDIHLLAEFHAGRADGLEQTQAVQRMIRRMAIAIVFTALTTFFGFATLISSTMPVLHEFGMAASFGLIANPIVTIFLVPACLALFPDRKKRTLKKPGSTRLEKYLLQALRSIHKNPKVTLCAVIIPCLIAAWFGIRTVEADNNVIGFFKKDSPVVQRVNRLHETLSGAESFYIRLDAPTPGAFKNPENLKIALRIQNYLTASAWTDRTVSLTDYLSHMHRTITQQPNPFPDSSNSISEYLMMLHRSEIEPYVSADFKNLNILVRHNLHSSKELTPRIEELRTFIAETTPQAFTVTVTGEMLLVNKAVSAIVHSQLKSILLIALVAAMLLSILFRSIRIGFIGLIPNLLPISVQFGIMSLCGIPLNTATSMAAAIGIGLAADDTIHLLLRFYSQEKNVTPAEAVDRSLHQLIRPVLTTSIALTLGFLVMRFSQFTPIRDFALLSAASLMTALLADLLVTPALLRLSGMRPAVRTCRIEDDMKETI